MSNYSIHPVNRDHEIMAGWDPAMNTYFAHVFDITMYEDDPKRDILWIGCTPNEIHDVDIISRELSPYADLDLLARIINKMYGDANG